MPLFAHLNFLKFLFVLWAAERKPFGLLNFRFEPNLGPRHRGKPDNLLLLVLH